MNLQGILLLMMQIPMLSSGYSPQLFVQNSPQVALLAQNQQTVGATDGPDPENDSFYVTEAQKIPLGHRGSESRSSGVRTCSISSYFCFMWMNLEKSNVTAAEHKNDCWLISLTILLTLQKS